VAGVAHEINSPAAAIAGTSDAFEAGVSKLTRLSPKLAWLGLDDERFAQFTELAEEAAAALRNRPIPSPTLVRRTSKQLRSSLEERGVDAAVAGTIARSLADLVPEPELLGRLADFVVPEGREHDADLAERSSLMLDYLREFAYLHRGAHTIQTSIRRVQRIVGGLKSYSHLDQEARADADLHDGIENTLVILEHVLSKGIHVRRSYGQLPPVPVFVDELNQVWTNLLHNAVQALGGTGNIAIETEHQGDDVVVRIIDDGPGIAQESLDKIFEPFYTTKPKGEGTGLGLRIVKQIVKKHRGTVTCESAPGRTCFEVRIPISMPDDREQGARA
ncbi:MAG: HAMP domain-containing histidine kinase, partial [Deltaproteobacteria bacterium]|nr:HAMP domain-containing histidine kinase [Deltaproteobacteria bacterium]